MLIKINILRNQKVLFPIVMTPVRTKLHNKYKMKIAGIFQTNRANKVNLADKLQILNRH